MASKLPDVNQILSMDDIRRLWYGYITHNGINRMYRTRSFYSLYKDRDIHFESFLNMLERNGYMLDNLYEEMNTPPDDSYETDDPLDYGKEPSNYEDKRQPPNFKHGGVRHQFEKAPKRTF
jgi:hypothetical protein